MMAYEINVKTYNACDAIRTIPYDSYNIQPGDERRVEALANFEGLWLVVGGNGREKPAIKAANGSMHDIYSMD